MRNGDKSLQFVWLVLSFEKGKKEINDVVSIHSSKGSAEKRVIKERDELQSGDYEPLEFEIEGPIKILD